MHNAPSHAGPRVAALASRVAKAVLDCERWRASGVQERYLQAFDDVEALELQLDKAIHSELLERRASAPP